MLGKSTENNFGSISSRFRVPSQWRQFF